MLRTKCVFQEPAAEDGYRVSVMSRDTLNDGVTPDLRIAPGETYDIKARPLAPSDKAVGAWYRGLAGIERRRAEDPFVGSTELLVEKHRLWEEFESAYATRLMRPEALRLMQDLADRAVIGNVTLLCVEPLGNIDYCHRKLLAGRIRPLRAFLQIRHV